MDDDPHAFCYQIEKEAAKAFNKAGRAAFEELVRARFNHARAQPEYTRRRWSDVLRAIYLAQRNEAAYAALAEKTGLRPQDCVALASILVSSKPERALEWVERGIDLDRRSAIPSTAAYDLARLQRELLTRLGRETEALDAAWDEYRKSPCQYSYADLMEFVPKAQRAAWHQKAMDFAEEAELSVAVELFVEARKRERLAGLLRRATDEALQGLSRYEAEPAAPKLEKRGSQDA